MKKLVIPKFASEREEAEWWDAHAEVVQANLLEAMRSGTAGRDILKRLADQRAAKNPAPAKSN
jgi:hypothetical protein